jgi:type I restriction enzyme R subunit
MTKLNEDAIERMAIEIFEEQGFEHLYGPDIAPDSDNSMRSSFEEVILNDILRTSIYNLNPTLTAEARMDALRQVQQIRSPDLMTNNETFHRLLTENVNVTTREKGEERGAYVRLVDFETPDNNRFHVINQFTVVEKEKNKRPDIILFVNGLPFVVIELKNPVREKGDMQSAYNQIQNYKENIPSLFTYNALCVLSDGLDARVGSVSSGYSRFVAWKSSDGKNEASRLERQLETTIKGMLTRETLLDLIQNFIAFETSKIRDSETGQTTIQKIKKIAAYHQYYAVNKIVDSIKKASESDGKGGVIWHTQGSGKSLSMVFASGKIVRILDNPTLVILTDRNDLDDQLFDTFAASSKLLRQEPVQAKDRKHLRELLNVVSGGIVFTTIQKFHPEEGSVHERLSDRQNIVVIVDEAHRTQYGFKAKEVDEKKDNKVVGKKTAYGFAKYMRDALPKATYLGFTGTPIEINDANTRSVFGDYVDIYDIERSRKDGMTVEILYESRLAKIELKEEAHQMINDLDDELAKEDLSDAQKSKAKWTQLEALVGSDNRIKRLAKDILTHFEERQSVLEGKGMIVTMSRRIAAKLYKEMVSLCPDLHDQDLGRGGLKVIMTTSSDDDAELTKHETTKEQRRILADRLKNPDDALKMVIVCDMWLTGFDVPCLHTMYMDKPMRGHNLMQAIARVNRVYKDKTGGLVVDYLGIASDLKKALSFYTEGGGKGNPVEDLAKAVDVMNEKLEVVQGLFDGFRYKDYFTSETREKLSLILAAEDHILGLEDGKKRYLDRVTALSKAFSIAIPHDRAMEIKEEVAFFQAVKVRLLKFDSKGEGKTDKEIETAIKQVIDEALVSDKVIDIFDAAGIKKPSISILSEEFMLEMKGMPHKNLAVETLKKLLNDEIKSRAKKNFVQGKKLMDLLENAIKRYHNKMITAVEVIDELIKLGQDIQAEDKEPHALGLQNYEYAFYTAIADNESAYEVLGKDKLRELAIILTEKIRMNASIDWTLKESVRAKLKVQVKRTLRKFGYPPDAQKLATDQVLKQAELIASELSQENEEVEV